MAIDDDRDAEILDRLGNQLCQRRVIGPIKPRQAQLGFARRKLRAIDFRAVAHDAWNDAKACRHPWARRIDCDRQAAVEHGGVDFRRRAIGVEKRPWKTSGDQRGAEPHRASE